MIIKLATIIYTHIQMQQNIWQTFLKQVLSYLKVIWDKYFSVIDYTVITLRLLNIGTLG